MEKEDIVGTGIICIVLGALIWFWMLLFHFSHKYKVVTRQHNTGILFSDNEFELKDRVVVSNVEGEYRAFTPNYGVVADTVTITKILR